jgi:hypothetical protein
MGKNLTKPNSGAAKKSAGQMVKRTEQPVGASNRDERDSMLAVETAAGKRLQKVAIEDGALVLFGNEEAQRLVFQAMGSDSREFQTYCLSQLLEILPEPASSETNDYTLPINSAVAMLAAIGPRDELEAMLAVQMVAANHLALKTMRLSSRAPSPENRQLNANLATKFSRTFTAQLEALGRHRRGGKQIVEHVHVNDGGQAVFANTLNTGGVRE